MPLSKQFKTTILARANRDAKFRKAMLVEAVNELLNGDFNAAKGLLRDYINASISFGLLASKADINSKSIQRMLGPAGNPNTESLIKILNILQKYEGIRLQVCEQRRSNR